MTKPLALLVHEKLLPGSQIASRFEELEYRVVSVTDPSKLLETARREMPMLVVVDLNHDRRAVLSAVAALRAEESTAHVPVLAHAANADDALRDEAIAGGVKIVAGDAAIVLHLEQLVERTLQIED